MLHSLCVVQLTKGRQRPAGLAAHLGNRKPASLLTVITVSQFSMPSINFLAYLPSHPFHHSSVATNSMEKCFQFLLQNPMLEFPVLGIWVSPVLPLRLGRWRIHLQRRTPGFDPWVGKIPWRRERLPAPVLWPGEFHGLCSPWGRKESDTTEWLSLSATVAKNNCLCVDH